MAFFRLDNATVVTSWRIFCKIHRNNIPLLKLLRELVLEILGKYGRNRPAQSLNTSGIARTSIKLDTLNHMVVKGESKYYRFQQCGRRTIFKWRKIQRQFALRKYETIPSINVNTLFVCYFIA